MPAYKTASPVTVTLEQLRTGAIDFTLLESAFGPDSLGIIVVKDLPQKFIPLRKKVLSYASHLGNLSAEELVRLENPEAKYLVGWSCGKERLSNDRIDTLKGSYYVNCAFYKDPKLDGAEGDYPNLPEYTSGNVWPREELLSGFKDAVQELVTLIIDTAVLVARACDRYAEKHIENYTPSYLEHVVKSSSTSKARLLHYFPPPPNSSTPENDEDLDDWCGTHKDHGCLTGLTSAMYVDEKDFKTVAVGGSGAEFDLEELDTAPDPSAGLYIHGRTGETYKVGIPRDALAFQTGEALEVITQGKLKAVPHFVRGCRSGLAGGVARNTLAVFTQPNLYDKVDETRDFAAFAKQIVEKNTAEEDVGGM
ncbi:hypothetical protein DFH27DRAFT_533628 [Peziza echinospora]|nr:hypothetical protein DFH27DRAFT_533628 [Peziza echinospora]